MPTNDAKAFEFYNQVANNHADDSPSSPQSAFVASAFVALGTYYLKGIDNTAVRPNVQKVTIKVGGKVKRANVCTKCMKAGKVERA